MQAIIKHIVLALLLGIAFNSNAQKFEGGVYFGLTTSQINGDNLSGYNKVGMNLGFQTALPIGENAKFQFELAFIKKGAKEVPSDTSNFYKASLNYIEIPLLFQYRWKYLSFDIGPGLDILVSSKEEWDGFPQASDPPFTGVNIVAIVGVNWHFSEKWYLSLRTNNSLSVIREGNANPGDNPSIIRFGQYGMRNIVLSTALVYHFDSKE